MPSTSPVKLQIPERRFLTVSELAEACAPINDEYEFDDNKFTVWTRRLRHWSVLDILPKKYIRHADEAGRHRLYSADLVYIAAVLLRIAGMGISVKLISKISHELQKAIDIKNSKFSEFWLAALEKQDSIIENYILSIWIADEMSFIYIDGLIEKGDNINTRGCSFEAEPTIAISLTKIFELIKT